MTHFFKSGNIFQVSGGSDIYEQLPVGNYVLKLNPMTGFYLEEVDQFKLPSKIYGNTNSHCQRILTTYQQRGRNTGVLLVGEKGSGKTLLMRQVAINSGIPVIIINSSFTGDAFSSYLTSITQPCIVLFDEFEKVYKQEDQEQVLTLLDGTYQSNKLFLITSNNKWSLDDNMKNRPGRIYYLFEYSGLEENFIREYCVDNLIDKTKTSSIVNVSNMFDHFNFDMLAAIVEEVNRYNEEPSDIVKFLNAKPEYCGESNYSIDVNIMNHRAIPSALDKYITLTPGQQDFSIKIRFCWDTSNYQNDEVLYDTISRKIDYGEATVEELSEWLDKGLIAFGQSSEQWGKDAKIRSDYGCFNFSSYDIIRYEGKCIYYKNDDGFLLTLTRINTRR